MLLFKLLEICILLARYERWAIFVDARKFTMPENHRIGIIDFKASQQGEHGCLLRWGARVGSSPKLV